MKIKINLTENQVREKLLGDVCSTWRDHLRSDKSLEELWQHVSSLDFSTACSVVPELRPSIEDAAKAIRSKYGFNVSNHWYSMMRTIGQQRSPLSAIEFVRELSEVVDSDMSLRDFGTLAYQLAPQANGYVDAAGLHAIGVLREFPYIFADEE